MYSSNEALGPTDMDDSDGDGGDIDDESEDRDDRLNVPPLDCSKWCLGGQTKRMDITGSGGVGRAREQLDYH